MKTTRANDGQQGVWCGRNARKKSSDLQNYCSPRFASRFGARRLLQTQFVRNLMQTLLDSNHLLGCTHCHDSRRLEDFSVLARMLTVIPSSFLFSSLPVGIYSTSNAKASRRAGLGSVFSFTTLARTLEG